MYRERSSVRRLWGHAWVRRISGLAIAVVIGVGSAHVLYASSVEPGAALVKATFESKPLIIQPSDYPAVSSTVAAVQRVALDPAGPVPSYLDIYRPLDSQSAPLPMVLWVHGGGFISSSSSTIADYARLLAARGFIVASLDYTVAPGMKHPVPVIQAENGLNHLRMNAANLGGDAGRLVIGGDSAGAQIASETAAAETNRALGSQVSIAPPTADVALRGVILFCGLYDMDSVASTGFPALRTYLWSYTGHRNWTTYPDIDQLSTTKQVTSGYPPTFISAGNTDPFEPQARELAETLQSRAVPVTTLFWDETSDELGHEYQFNFLLPEAQDALDQTQAFISKYTAS